MEKHWPDFPNQAEKWGFNTAVRNSLPCPALLFSQEDKIRKASFGNAWIRTFHNSFKEESKYFSILKHSKDKFLALLTDGIATALSDKEITDCILDCGDVHHAASR